MYLYRMILTLAWRENLKMDVGIKNVWKKIIFLHSIRRKIEFTGTHGGKRKPGEFDIQKIYENQGGNNK